MSEAGLSLLQIPAARWGVARRGGVGAKQSLLGQCQAWADPVPRCTVLSSGG